MCVCVCVCVRVRVCVCARALACVVGWGAWVRVWLGECGCGCGTAHDASMPAIVSQLHRPCPHATASAASVTVLLPSPAEQLPTLVVPLLPQGAARM